VTSLEMVSSPGAEEERTGDELPPLVFSPPVVDSLLLVAGSAERSPSPRPSPAGLIIAHIFFMPVN
jgi:hypothetical protein